MRFDFITIGGAVEDITLYTNESTIIDNKKDVLKQKLVGFEYGAKMVIKKYDSFFGGGATNTAVSLARLGFKTGTLISIGNDLRGTEIKENLRVNGVSTHLVKESKNDPTGFSVVVVGSDNEHIIFTVRGANSKLDFNFLEKKILANSKYLYISSLSGEWKSFLEKVFAIKGPRIVWNPGKTQLEAGVNKLKKFFKKTNILFLNKDEAIELVTSLKIYKNKTSKFFDDKKKLLEIVKSFGPKMVVITDSKNGVDVYDGEEFCHKGSIVKAKEVVDTTGVGDSFCSSFVAGYEKYGDIKKAVNLGVKNAASVLKKTGAQNGLLQLKIK